MRVAPIRILIADDHPVVCFGLRGIIRTQPDMTAALMSALSSRELDVHDRTQAAVAAFNRGIVEA